MKIPEVMAELLEEHYTYKDIFTQIKYIDGLIQAAYCWSKEYIKTMTLKVGFKNSVPTLVYYTA